MRSTSSKVASLLAASLTLSLLAGCAMGVKEDGSNAKTGTFSAPVTYQEAYRRADAFVRHCHTSNGMWKGSLNIDGSLYTDNRTGVVHVSQNGLGRDLETIKVSDASGASAIDVSMWDIGVWDEREMAAIKRSITIGEPICRSDIKT